jgi:hypothetical protein
MVFLAAFPATADWINMTGAQSAPNIAEIYIEEDHVRVVLEIYVGDLDKFVDLLPDDWLTQSGVKSPPFDVLMHDLSVETLQIIADDTTHLVAKPQLVEPRMRKERPNPFAGSINIVTGRPVPGPPEDKRVLYAELIYPFKNRPSTLTMIPLLDQRGFPAISIGFIAYHKNVPVVDYRFMQKEARLQLDWNDPWYSKFDKKALKRWQQSGLMTYLYVEPFEVRHETLVRVKDMEAWIDLELRGDEYIETDEFEPLKRRIGEFLLQHSKVLIDGQSLRPILDRASFVKYTMTRTFFIDQPERMPLNIAMVGVIVTYLTKEIPQKVTVNWDLFSDKIQQVPTTAVDPAGPFPSYVTPDDNLFTWKNFLKTYQMPTVAEVDVDESLTTLKIPLASTLCLLALLPLGLQIRKRRKNAGSSIGLYVGLAALLIAGSVVLYPFLKVAVAKPAVLAPKMTDDKAVTVLNSEEEDVYDRLATSVQGNLLSEIYLQNRKSMVVTRAGGAQARVKAVEILDVDVNNLDDHPLGLLFHAKWTAMGSVGHWGHIHFRKNQYEANISVEPVDGAWKITGLELLEEQRIDTYANPAKGKN